MRFASKALILCAALCAPALAHSQSFPRAPSDNAEAAAEPRDPADIRRRAVGSSEQPIITKGLYAQRVATSLGHISAMVSLEDGSIYALEQNKGQLFHLTDRGLDGRIDTQRAITSGFDKPSGLTLNVGRLFVSDRQAIWEINLETGAKTQFVSLKNISAGDDRPLLAYKDKLLLGLSLTANTSSVLSIDMASGVAVNLTDIPEAPIRGLSYGGGQLWAAAGGSLRPIDQQASTEFAKHYRLEKGAAALAVLLPPQDNLWPQNWPAAMKSYILAIQGPAFDIASERASGGNNVAALPTQFGAPTSNLSVLAGGFMGRSGQSAWAAPTALLMDSRGLFFADRLGGTLWQIKVDNRPAPKPRAKISKPLPPLPVQKPSLKPNETPAMAGSMIGEASSLGSASTLKVGSYLKKQHDEKEAAELAAKTAAEEAAVKAKADARDARRRRLRPNLDE